MGNKNWSNTGGKIKSHHFISEIKNKKSNGKITKIN